VVCGPTASGKSDVADELAERATGKLGARVPTLAVDSMQVYAEIPAITNQARRRPAEMVGIVPVTESWTVARHRDLALELVGGAPGAFVLDAGTGMYLNAILLQIPLAPKVDEDVRALAEASAAGEPNPRRAARSRELALAGAPARSSIWEGELRYEVGGIYLRPDRSELDARISARSRKIVREGIRDAETLRAMAEAGARISPSVLDSIGVRELLDHLQGEISLDEACDRVSARTRRLARRQMRWFDKLARTLEGRATMRVARDPTHADTLHTIHDILGT
jgi:tRNA dimethylallyltransferase